MPEKHVAGAAAASRLSPRPPLPLPAAVSPVPAESTQLATAARGYSGDGRGVGEGQRSAVLTQTIRVVVLTYKGPGGEGHPAWQSVTITVTIDRPCALPLVAVWAAEHSAASWWHEWDDKLGQRERASRTGCCMHRLVVPVHR